VNLSATVSDKKGVPVDGLTERDFSVYEDGKLQTIAHFSAERTPVSLGIVLDVSPQVFQTNQIPVIRSAISRLLSARDGTDSEFFILAFAHDSRRLAQSWTQDAREIEVAVVESVRRSEREDAEQGRQLLGTRMYDAVAEALPTMAKGRHRKKAMIIISSGANFDSSAVPATLLRRVLRESDLLVYAIGIGAGGPPTLNCEPPACVGMVQTIPNLTINERSLAGLTTETGGRVIVARFGKEAERAIDSIAAELGHQYFLGYQRTGTTDGLWHRINVVVRDGTLNVRTRQGYRAY
jgi:Ca-activated chloride channel family protein